MARFIGRRTRQVKEKARERAVQRARDGTTGIKSLFSNPVFLFLIVLGAVDVALNLFAVSIPVLGSLAETGTEILLEIISAVGAVYVQQRM